MTPKFLPALCAALVALAPAAPAVAASPETAPAAEAVAYAKAERFAYRIVRPADADGRTIVLMHGSGGDETSLVGLASQIAPRATLVGIRGRVTQEGRARWYRRITPVSFDQADIRAEAAAFARFLPAAAQESGLDLDDALFLGYSNGANLLAAVALLHPGLVRNAALLRPMQVLDPPPAAMLEGTRLLMVAGRDDRLYAPFAPALETLLRNCGAAVEARTIVAGHAIGDADAALVAGWLAQARP